jgi:hypothetical protein
LIGQKGSASGCGCGCDGIASDRDRSIDRRPASRDARTWSATTAMLSEGSRHRTRYSAVERHRRVTGQVLHHRLRECVAKGRACRRRYETRAAGLLAEIVVQIRPRIVECRREPPSRHTREAVGSTAPLCRCRAEVIAAEAALERSSSSPVYPNVSRSCGHRKFKGYVNWFTHDSPYP